ncbi:MAG TPA: hypothetical protein VI027_01395 [Rubrobacteraceae bacterium]
MAAIGAPTTKRQASSAEEVVKHELNAGGRSPIEAHRYDELRALAIAILKEGLDPGDFS